ncbi:MAG: hypothetical protein M3Z66_18640 [Chloroflexota bacterium]|nr:hypothetical protein [Chloroflexota bacterium]
MDETFWQAIKDVGYAAPAGLLWLVARRSAFARGTTACISVARTVPSSVAVAPASDSSIRPPMHRLDHRGMIMFLAWQGWHRVRLDRKSGMDQRWEHVSDAE